MPDVEMKPAGKEEKKEDEKDKGKEKKEEEEVKKEPLTPLAEIKGNFVLIDRAVSTLEPRFTQRVLRTLTTLVKKLDDTILRDAIEQGFPKGLLSFALLESTELKFTCRIYNKSYASLLATSCIFYRC